MEWSPDAAVVHRHIDDVGLSIHVLSSLSQKTHSNLHTWSTFQCNNYTFSVSLSSARDGTLSSVTVIMIVVVVIASVAANVIINIIIIIINKYYYSVVSNKNFQSTQQ